MPHCCPVVFTYTRSSSLIVSGTISGRERGEEGGGRERRGRERRGEREEGIDRGRREFCPVVSTCTRLTSLIAKTNKTNKLGIRTRN
jgi:hypothetical protein